MAMDTGFATIKEVHWVPGECPEVEMVCLVSEYDSLCSQKLFRSKKVKPVVSLPFKVKAPGLTKPHCTHSAKEIFLQLLDSSTVQTLCKRVNNHAVEEYKLQKRKEKWKAIDNEDFLSWIAVALQGGLFEDLKEDRVKDVISVVEKWQDKFPGGRFPEILQYLKGMKEDQEAQWETIRNLQGKLTQNFQRFYTPEQKLGVRKCTFRFKGQAAKSGPICSELKVAILFDLECGYVCNFFLYSADHLCKQVKSPLVVHILHELLKPYYNKGYHVQLDSSAYMGGRLNEHFAPFGIFLHFTSFWTGYDFNSTSSNTDGHQDLSSSVCHHLQGWTGPVIFPLSTEPEELTFLQTLWLMVHLSCVGSFVLSSQQCSKTISLYKFTKALATQLANKEFSSRLLLPPLVCNDLSINADKNVTGFSEECKALEYSSSFERDVSSPKQGRRPIPSLTGLINSGNSCYMNAVLQCLSGTASLVEYLLSSVNQDELARRRSDVVCAFITLLTEMWTGEYEHISPVEIRTVIGSLHPQFASNTQQDAQELLLYLFNGLHEDLKKATVRKQPRGSLKRQEAGKSSGHSRETSIITHLFEGQLCYVTLCLQCDNQTRTNEVFTILSLPIPPEAYRCSLLVRKLIKTRWRSALGTRPIP
ncbi:Inactive ubiquitin carboxyl-terminal hydrolase 50 [Acipenser ruthenus]|uniref:ubiquitinyl hydrolase 1 n=1 Tax=Acipenser ruthenus TaxID=7906 RepID=A0A444UT43_ACIRT|nr:Inactive ubiquitin carboxyl-terminal hydrolase 50 [Acipenser ruthenus]